MAVIPSLMVIAAFELMRDHVTMFGQMDWKTLVRQYWWLRGIASAVTLAALVPKFVDLSRYEFLRAFHAVIVGWNIVCEAIGQTIGRLPYIPELSSDLVNTIIFASSITIPLIASYVILNKKQEFQELYL